MNLDKLQLFPKQLELSLAVQRIL